MKANKQATIPMGIFIDYRSENSNVHTQIFRGIKTGVAIALVIFWLPISAIIYLWGWRYIFVYVAFILAIFIASGLISRYYVHIQPIVYSKTSVKKIRS